MIAFDTNYVVRHLVQDDKAQSARVAKTIQAEVEAGRQILIPDLVLCEVSWVLESCYAATRKDLVKAFESLRHESAFRYEDSNRMTVAIKSFEKGKADFADYLIVETCRPHNCKLISFDKRLAKEL